MGIALGYLCLLCVCLLGATALAHGGKREKAARRLRRLHKPVCAALILLCALHIVLVLPVVKTRSIWVVFAGTCATILLVTIVGCYHVMTRDAARRLLWHRILAGAMALCILGHMAGYMLDYRGYQEAIDAIVLTEIDVGTLADGQYEGSFDAGYVAATVCVTVADGAITDILLRRHENEHGQAAQAVIGEIINQQKFPVDAVSGATNSSSVIQMAIANALQQGK